MSPLLGGGATLLGGGIASPPIGREIGPHVPSTRAPLPPGKTQAQRDAEDAARLYVPVAVELLGDTGGGADGGDGAAGTGDAGDAGGDSSGEGADGAGEGGSW